MTIISSMEAGVMRLVLIKAPVEVDGGRAMLAVGETSLVTAFGRA